MDDEHEVGGGDLRVELWRAEHGRLSAAALARFGSGLTAEERGKMLRYRREQDQRRYLVGRGMLRWLLEQHTGRPAAQWTFVLGPFGRPELPPDADFCHGGSAPLFNLSHTRGVTVAAISHDVRRLGADVEERQRVSNWELADRYFAPSEARTVAAARPEEKGELFLRFWTLKEAYVKAVGQGISMGLDTFAFQLAGRRPPTVEFTGDKHDTPAEAWHFFELPLAHERVAVAAQSAHRPNVQQRDFLL